MVIGISYIALGIYALHLFKEKKTYNFKFQGIMFITSGTFVFISWVINLFVKSENLQTFQLLIIIITILYNTYKTRQWDEAKKVMNELTKKRF